MPALATDTTIGSIYLIGGDSYATMALGVVTDETQAGYIANQFLQGAAADLGRTVSSSENWQIGVDLMNADLNARTAAFNNGASDGGLTLDVTTIYRYHQTVFQEHGLGDNNEAWTAALPLRDAIESGD